MLHYSADLDKHLDDQDYDDVYDFSENICECKLKKPFPWHIEDLENGFVDCGYDKQDQTFNHGFIGVTNNKRSAVQQSTLYQRLLKRNRSSQTSSFYNDTLNSKPNAPLLKEEQKELPQQQQQPLPNQSTTETQSLLNIIPYDEQLQQQQQQMEVDKPNDRVNNNNKQDSDLNNFGGGVIFKLSESTTPPKTMSSILPTYDYNISEVIPTIDLGWKVSKTNQSSSKSESESQQTMMTKVLSTTHPNHKQYKAVTQFKSAEKIMVSNYLYRYPTMLKENPIGLWSLISKALNNSKSMFDIGLYITEMEESNLLLHEQLVACYEQRIDVDNIEENEDKEQQQTEGNQIKPKDQETITYDDNECWVADDKKFTEELAQSETANDLENNNNFEELKEAIVQLPLEFQSSGIMSLLEQHMCLPHGEVLYQMRHSLVRFLRKIISDLSLSLDRWEIDAQRVVDCLADNNALPHPEWIPTKAYQDLLDKQHDKDDKQQNIDLKLISNNPLFSKDMYKK
ncbi:hypothetical protein PPL_07567 [Heterostelium album PN500]|uniref:Uncharacterized protein n=1 Tax=Heterostelium pallidum (strain ATCC 26659 / Pp 5 / PN500) TaxID=670386 RepID=D3BGB6_HETP5|nr:hypothetical protein PPL_07567 [Heterostelium album PN500]EFA79516.1 hypothetical protein PPL_07567 [Heterostelium album PN500]|eukprot:XP_020431637.1 hypothetical protein PPL_07567 [Heterostelium album PN500]